MTVDLLSVRAGDVVILRDKTAMTVARLKPTEHPVRKFRVVFQETGQHIQYTDDGREWPHKESSADIIAIFGSAK